MGLGRRISWHSMVINATQDWTLFEFVTTSWDGKVGLSVGLQPDNANPLDQVRLACCSADVSPSCLIVCGDGSR